MRALGRNLRRLLGLALAVGLLWHHHTSPPTGFARARGELDISAALPDARRSA
jgi:hypothetical protein